MRAGREEAFPGEPHPEPPHQDRWSRVLLAAAPVGALLLSLYVVPLPVFVEAPGPARDVLRRIDVDGTTTYPAEGRLLLTTVNIGRVSAYHAIGAWIDPNAELVPERDVLPPGQTEREFERLSLSQMDSSKIAAVAVALERLTDYPEERGSGVIVHSVFDGAPATGNLFPGDLIVQVDGDRLRDPGHLRTLIRAAGTGRMRFTVRPVEGGELQTVELRPVRVRGEPRPLIGIVTLANFPFRVVISSGDIGGPSAGLMWALGLADILTPGNLTEGRVVAGTGDLNLDGHVRGIGGIRLKIVAAERAGARTFILPRANLEEARGAGEAIRLVPVETFGEALRFLTGNLGDRAGNWGLGVESDT